MNIFVKIKNSIYSPKYYKEVLEKPFSYSFKFLLAFALLFAVVFAVVATVKLTPFVSALPSKLSLAPNYFPQELIISVKNGVVSTNVQEPYFIKMPDAFKDNNGFNSSDAKINGIPANKLTQLDNLVVIDTKNKFDVATFNSYKTFLLLTADSAIYMKDGAITVAPLSEVKDVTLNRDIISMGVNKVKPYLVILYPIIIIGAYIGGFFLVLVHMVYLLFGALLVWLIAKIKELKIGYKGSYKAGMQLMITPIIITSILGAISPKLTFTFLFSILLIISAFLNLKKDKAQEATPSVV